MNMEQVKEIANAVLYEGYLLYPYRHSAIKNRQRWTIGVVYPREYSEANGGFEPWMMQTECLIAGEGNADWEKRDILLDVHIRFLHLLVRSVVEDGRDKSRPYTEEGVIDREEHEWGLASRMANEPYEEGVEREIAVTGCSLSELLVRHKVVEIYFPGQRLVEDSAEVPGVTIVREQLPVMGSVLLSAEAVGDSLFKVGVQIENRTPETGALSNWHNKALLQSFVSTHTIMQVHQGEFISLLDPPEAVQAIARECKNIRTWPVLVGSEGETDALLSSPIILYDYPQLAPESPGNLFDGTEIDEILTLRILTLTDEEKEEMRQGDARVREILERTEQLPAEQFMKLHGAVRSLRPLKENEL